MFTVYVVKSQANSKTYVGQTADIERRFKEHNLGLARYTRGRGPWELVLTEEYQTRAEAMKRERFLKSGKGRELIKGLVGIKANPPTAD